MRSIKIVIPNERPPSWNQLYSAKLHWSKRMKLAQEKHLLVRACLDPNSIEMFEGPVQITFTVYFKDRPQDIDNIAPKMYIDGLKGWIIEDDDWRYVQKLTINKPLVDRDNPRIEMLIEEINVA